MKKKLRVYYKSSLLKEHKYFRVESVGEAKRLIKALESTVADIIKENSIPAGSTWAIGLEELDSNDGEWYDWMHQESGQMIGELN